MSKLGRPPKPKGELKSKRINIRLTDQEYKDFTRIDGRDMTRKFLYLLEHYKANKHLQEE